MATLLLALLVALVRQTVSQWPGNQKPNAPLKFDYQECTAPGTCTTKNGAVVLEANWMWLHKKGTYTNCYEGAKWDPTLCPDPTTCAQNCALDAGGVAEYQEDYGVSVQEKSSLKLSFVTKQQYGTNVGSRLFLLGESSQKYQMFTLKNKEFTFGPMPKLRAVDV